MVECPKCKTEIDNLRFSSKVENYGNFSINDQGDEDWDTDDYGDWEDIELTCPNCDKVLFTDCDEAIEFLKGGKNEH